MKDTIKRYVSDARYNDFEKVISELNFQNDMRSRYTISLKDTIQLKFGNSWVLLIMDDGFSPCSIITDLIKMAH